MFVVRATANLSLLSFLLLSLHLQISNRNYKLRGRKFPKYIIFPEINSIKFHSHDVVQICQMVVLAPTPGVTDSQWVVRGFTKFTEHFYTSRKRPNPNGRKVTMEALYAEISPYYEGER